MSRSRRNNRRRRSGLAPQRLGVLAAASLCGFALLGVRAAQLQAIDASRLAQIAAGQSEATLRIQPQRARIEDRHGNLLASSAEVESVAAAPRKLNAVLAAPHLARALGMKTRDVYHRLDSRGRFVWIKRWVEPDEAARVRALGLEGVTLQKERRRFYPNGEMAAAYIGFAGRDGRGLTGLELFHDPALRGEAAAIPARRDGSGRKLPQIASAPGPDGLSAGEAGLPARGASLPSGAGRPLVLSLDAKLQFSADKALQRATARTKARSATLIAMEPHSGDVLAIAHSPTFNPNRFWEEDPARFRVNAFVDSFEPGSTLKPFSIAIALEAGVVKPGDAFDCEQGAWRVRNRTIHDMKPHDVLTVHDILRVSSNIGAAKIAERVGAHVGLTGRT